MNACKSSIDSVDNNVKSNIKIEEGHKTGGKEDNANPDNVKKNNEIQNEELEHERLYKLVGKYVTGINSREPNLMLECIDKESDGGYGIEVTKGILGDYMAYFNNSNSIKYRFIKHKPNATYGNNKIHIYELYDDNQKIMKIEVLKRVETEFINDICIYYSVNVHRYINWYVNALKSKDLKEISKIFTIPVSDKTYPLSNAKIILENYSKTFQLNTVGYRLTNIDGNEYILEIYGVKDGKENKHQIKVACGHGLVSIRDEWAPIYNE